MDFCSGLKETTLDAKECREMRLSKSPMTKRNNWFSRIWKSFCLLMDPIVEFSLPTGEALVA